VQSVKSLGKTGQFLPLNDGMSDPICRVRLDPGRSFNLSVLTAIFQVNLGYPVFIEAKDDGGGRDS